MYHSCVSYFCRGVKCDILNEKKQAPIHLVTELNKVAVLQVMTKHKNKFDIQQGGEHGRTALHIAAIYDHEECARILVSNQGNLQNQHFNKNKTSLRFKNLI